jgi:hypothetical protein
VSLSLFIAISLCLCLFSIMHSILISRSSPPAHSLFHVLYPFAHRPLQTAF